VDNDFSKQEPTANVRAMSSPSFGTTSVLLDQASRQANFAANSLAEAEADLRLCSAVEWESPAAHLYRNWLAELAREANALASDLPRLQQSIHAI
jgi:hypothetical protein